MPFAGKYGFLCAPETQAMLARAVRDSDALLFIGFSGNDKDLLDFLEANIPEDRTYLMDIVSVDDVEDVAERLIRGAPKLEKSREGAGLRRQGFAKFVEDDLSDFLDRVEAAG